MRTGVTTQEIRSILIRFRESKGDAMLPGEAEMLAGALAAVEAIEAAAKVVHAHGLAVTWAAVKDEDWPKTAREIEVTENLMAAIAREAK